MRLLTGSTKGTKAQQGLRPTDIKPPDHSVFDSKDVVDHLIGQEIPFEIAHHLMYFDDHFLFGVFGKCDRLDVRIDQSPLSRPITAHSFAPMDVPSFHTVCPNHIFVQRGEDCFHFASVEAIVDLPQ
jgi:hypothetical protein